MTTTSADRLPPLDLFFAIGLGPRLRSAPVDAASCLDAALAEQDAERLPALVDALRGLRDRVGDEAGAQRALGPWLDDVGVPDGPTWSGYLDVLVERATQVLADPALVPAGLTEPFAVTDPGLPRVSSFPSVEVANAVATALVRSGGDDLDQWDADQCGLPRRHLHADLASTRGEVGVVVVPDDPRGSVLRPASSRTATTAASLVLAREPLSGNLFVLSCYPDVRLDPEVRARYPALRDVVGGWFGQDHEPALAAMHEVGAGLGEPARSQVRAELAALLRDEPTDDGVRAVLEHCGSHLLPRFARHWVDRFAWRLGAFASR